MPSIIKNISSIFLTVAGYIYFLITKKTPNIVYQSYVRSYCYTNGKISKFLNSINKYFIFENYLIKKNEIKSEYNFNKINDTLTNDGYYVFPEKIDEKTVEQILSFSLKTECFYYDDQGEKKVCQFNPNLKPFEYKSSKYSFKEADLFNFDPIHKILFDKNFSTIAQNYFNSKPCYSDLAMWWSPTRNFIPTEYLEKANQSAQKFHFDLDRIKWLKLFIYLTDTNEDSGPHEYVKGTHRISGKPKNLLNKGYHRIAEESINQYFSKDKIIKLLGPKGTMFIADTSCFHRGCPPLNQHRLILIIEFASSMFGANFSKINSFKNQKNSKNLITDNKIINNRI